MANPGSQARFVEGNLLRHVTVMSLTSSVGLMAIFAVDFVNMIFISMLGQAELAAAIGYAGAILFFTTSFGIGMGIGVGALTARALGARDPAGARTRATNGLILGVIFGVVFAALVWMALSPLVSLLGATGQTHDLAVHYLQIVIPSQPLLMVGVIGGAILRSHGDARRAMLATVFGGLANAVLDPILIFGFGWELTGAAISSVVARVVIAAVALLPILRHYGGFDRPDFGSAVHCDRGGSRYGQVGGHRPTPVQGAPRRVRPSAAPCPDHLPKLSVARLFLVSSLPLRLTLLFPTPTPPPSSSTPARWRLALVPSAWFATPMATG